MAGWFSFKTGQFPAVSVGGFFSHGAFTIVCHVGSSPGIQAQAKIRFGSERSVSLKDLVSGFFVYLLSVEHFGALVTWPWSHGPA